MRQGEPWVRRELAARYPRVNGPTAKSPGS